MNKHTPTLTAIGDRIYGETPKDGLIARVYGDAELAALFAAAPETAAERDRLREINAELVEALYGVRDYFESNADADLPSGSMYLPNEEMKVLVAIDAAIARAEGSDA